MDVLSIHSVIKKGTVDRPMKSMWKKLGVKFKAGYLFGAVVKVTCACWNAAVYQDHLPLCPAILTLAVPYPHKLHGPFQQQSCSWYAASCLSGMCQGISFRGNSFQSKRTNIIIFCTLEHKQFVWLGHKWLLMLFILFCQLKSFGTSGHTFCLYLKK